MRIRGVFQLGFPNRIHSVILFFAIWERFSVSIEADCEARVKRGAPSPGIARIFCDFFFWNCIVGLTSVFQSASIDFTMTLHRFRSSAVSSLCSSVLIYTKLREIVFNIYLPGKFGCTFRGLSYSNMACPTAVSSGSLIGCPYSLTLLLMMVLLHGVCCVLLYSSVVLILFGHLMLMAFLINLLW